MTTENHLTKNSGPTKPLAGPSREEFLKHLNEASTIVREWPSWKQEILGGTATTPKETARIAQQS